MEKHDKSLMDLINKLGEVTHQMESLFNELPEAERYEKKFVNPIEKQLNTLFLKHQLTFWKKEAEKMDIEQAKRKKQQQLQINQMIVNASMEGLKKEGKKLIDPSGGPIDPNGKDKPPELKVKK